MTSPQPAQVPGPLPPTRPGRLTGPGRRWVALAMPRPLTWFGPVALQAAKTAVAAGLSWFVAANLVGNNIPVFAPLAALLTVQVTIWESVSRGLQRVVGVIVGVLVAYGFARLAGINAWSIALVIFVSLVAGRALRLGQQGSVQVPVSALLVLALGAATKGYAVDRVVDTAIGAGFGVLVNLVIVPRPHLAKAAAQVQAFAGSLASLLAGLGDGLSEPARDWAKDLDQARRLSARASAAAMEVERAEIALRWNPAGRRARATLEQLQGAVAAMSRAERPARGIARALADMPPGWQLPTTVVETLARLLGCVAAEVSSWSADVTSAAAGGEGAAGTGGEAAGVPGPARTVASAFTAVLTSVRLPEVPPEAAAVASSIALDANRINDELRSEPEVPPASHLKWQSIFAP